MALRTTLTPLETHWITKNSKIRFLKMIKEECKVLLNQHRSGSIRTLMHLLRNSQPNKKNLKTSSILSWLKYINLKVLVQVETTLKILINLSLLNIILMKLIERKGLIHYYILKKSNYHQSINYTELKYIKWKWKIPTI